MVNLLRLHFGVLSYFFLISLLVALHIVTESGKKLSTKFQEMFKTC